MPEIIPQFHMQYLRDQRDREDKQLDYGRLMQRQAVMTSQINKVFSDYEVDKDSNKAKQQLSAIGSMYQDLPSGQRLMASNLDNYFEPEEQTPLVEYDQATGKTKQVGILPKNTKIIEKETKFTPPDDFEITGYDSKGNPKYEKIGLDKPLPASLQKVKDTRAQEFIDAMETNKIKREDIETARQSLDKIKTGLGGKLRKGFSKNFAPNDPMLQDWQNIKMVLTDAQLLNTAKTKGAISDAEMRLFSSAAANDDLTSAKEIVPVLNKLIIFIEADEKSKAKTYQSLYGKNPYEEFGYVNNQVPIINSSGQKQGGQLMTDAQGNKAIVYPDGSFEEVQ